MINSSEIKVLDRNSEFFGISNNTLMENAGKGVADFINKNLKISKKNILLFCGLGNNGGDGFVAARYLSKNNNVSVFLTGKHYEIKTKLAKKNFIKLKKEKIRIFDINDIKNLEKILLKNEVILDSMLGIGISGKLREPYQTIVKKINSLGNKSIISVDIPTGFKTNNSIKPDFTITFHDVKTDMNKNNCGKIKIVDIGIPKKAIEYIGPGELTTYYPIPKKESHKGQNGRLLIIGGGPYYGAPALSCFAAQRTGVDLVYLATPKKVAKAITSYSPLMIRPIRLAKSLAKYSPNLIIKELTNENILVEDDVKVIEPFIKKVDTLLIGPGLGDNKKTQNAVKKIIRLFVKNKKSIVIDADAIQVVGKNLDLIKNSKTIITPHSGEFKELTREKLSDNLDLRIKYVKKWAKKIGVTIVLKGPVDIVSNGKFTKLNDIHNPSMTAGGTGDVLAGIIAGLLSKGVNIFNSARIGVFINGSAGNLAVKNRSYGIVATDLIEEIPNVFKNNII